MSNTCLHCGEPNGFDSVEWNGNEFCCWGCKSVYELLNESDLANFYDLNTRPGVRPASVTDRQFAYLDDPEVQKSLLEFEDDDLAVVEFHIPVIHCSSCVWLLESLRRLNPNIHQSTVNYNKKRLRITYVKEGLALSELAAFLSKLGYKPNLNARSDKYTERSVSRTLVYKLVLAGFCFGNIMLLAFPEYTDSGEFWLEQNKNLFRFAMLLLSLPVLFYSAADYFKSAYSGLRFKIINIDVPIALGLIILFLRSVYDISLDISPGYFDSLCGLVFFMLIGKWFQQKTYSALAFDSEYGDFYPMTVRVKKPIGESVVLLRNLEKGEQIIMGNEDLVPADGIVIDGTGAVDSSFITGESRWLSINKGDTIYAGSVYKGSELLLETTKEVEESYLTKLWQNAAFDKKGSQINKLVNAISAYFTWAILGIAVLAAIYWSFIDSSQIVLVVTAVLIVACPCALALSSPFIYGNLMRIYGRNKCYLKDANVLERMSEVGHLVVDKTGTLTDSDALDLSYSGVVLSAKDRIAIGALAALSRHPLSRALAIKYAERNTSKITDFKEEIGLGLRGLYQSDAYAIGSARFLNVDSERDFATVGVSKNGLFLGSWEVGSEIREGVVDMIREIQPLPITLLSGDDEREKKVMQNILPLNASLHFNQTPQGKLNFVSKLEQKALMLGDGLNDSGALKASHVGMALADDLNRFTPACDAILEAQALGQLPAFLRVSKIAKYLVWTAFIISFLYNVVGLAFAVSGSLTPVVAAILMPVSSITVVIFATVSSRIVAILNGLKW